MFPLKILSVLVALLLMASVRAETNVTIDDTDPSIVYHPSGVWLFQGNVRPSPFSSTAGTHFYYRHPSPKTGGIRRRIIHPNLGQQHPSPLLLSTLSIYRRTFADDQVVERTSRVLHWIRYQRDTPTSTCSYHSPTPTRQRGDVAIRFVSACGGPGPDHPICQ